MSRTGGFTSSTAPTGWVFLDRHRTDGFTIRWKRGDSVAYVLAGQRIGDHAMTGVLGTLISALAAVNHEVPEVALGLMEGRMSPGAAA